MQRIGAVAPPVMNAGQKRSYRDIGAAGDEVRDAMQAHPAAAAVSEATDLLPPLVELACSYLAPPAPPAVVGSKLGANILARVRSVFAKPEALRQEIVVYGPQGRAGPEYPARFVTLSEASLLVAFPLADKAVCTAFGLAQSMDEEVFAEYELGSTPLDFAQVTRARR